MSKNTLQKKKDQTLKEMVDDKVQVIEPFMDFAGVDPGDAYVSIMIALLQEMFMSGDAKFLIIHKSVEILKTRGYTQDELKDFYEKVQKCMDEFHQPNDFMG